MRSREIKARNLISIRGGLEEWGDCLESDYSTCHCLDDARGSDY